MHGKYIMSQLVWGRKYTAYANIYEKNMTLTKRALINKYDKLAYAILSNCSDKILPLRYKNTTSREHLSYKYLRWRLHENMLIRLRQMAQIP